MKIQRQTNFRFVFLGVGKEEGRASLFEQRSWRRYWECEYIYLVQTPEALRVWKLKQTFDASTNSLSVLSMEQLQAMHQSNITNQSYIFLTWRIVYFHKITANCPPAQGRGLCWVFRFKASSLQTVTSRFLEPQVRCSFSPACPGFLGGWRDSDG